MGNFNISMGIKCCKDCVPPKRHLKCHSNCEEYLKEKAKNEEVNKKKGKFHNAENDFIEVRGRKIRRR